MNTLLRIFNVGYWSIRTKLLVAIVIAFVIPIIGILIVLEAGSQIRDQATTESYVQQVGLDRQRNLESDVALATGTFSDLINNLRYRRDIVNLFEGRADRAARQSIVDLFLDRLIRTNLYFDVRLINGDGVAVANTLTTLSTTQLDGTDLTSTVGYQAARDAYLLNEDQRIVVYTDDTGRLLVDVAQVLYYSDRTLTGYIVATLNTDEILIENLRPSREFIPLMHYLTTNDGLIITSPETTTAAQDSRQRQQVESALLNPENISTYLIEDDLFSAYVTPIEGTRFLLVSETLEEIALTSPVDAFFAGNGVILLAITAFVGGVLVLLLNSTITNSLELLHLGIVDASRGNYATPIDASQRHDEIGTLAQAFVNMREQVRDTIYDLESRVAARVRDIQATQEVSRFASTQRDLQTLMNEVVNLIINAFPNIYHAQIFLIDTEGKNAVLRASTGEAGRQLLSRGHRLGVGSVSVIGAVTSEGRTIIARDTSASNVHKRNEFLMETRAELAIPLRVGNHIIGALDVQSRQDNSFTDDQVKILQVMADQIAISLDNARLYQESISRLEQITDNSRKQTLSAWQEHMYYQRSKAMTSQSGIITETDTNGLRERAIRDGKVVVGEPNERNTVAFAVPIQLRGQVLGAVVWELPLAEYSYEKVLLADELVNRLAISLDNARLFEQSQRAIERERVVNDIASKLTGQTDIDKILQTAIREVGQALRVPEVNIRLSFDNENKNGTSANGQHEN